MNSSTKKKCDQMLLKLLQKKMTWLTYFFESSDSWWLEGLFFSIHTIHDDSQDSLFRFMRFIMTRMTLFFDSCDSSWLERLFGRVINQRVMWLDWSSIVCMTRPSLVCQNVPISFWAWFLPHVLTWNFIFKGFQKIFCGLYEHVQGIYSKRSA